MKWVILVFVLFYTRGAMGQTAGFEFSLLRQNDNLSAFRTDSAKTFYQALKYTPLFRNGSVSVGGSYRGQYELFINEEFSYSPNKENGWYLQRVLLHTDLRINQKLRIFGELGSSIIDGKENLSLVDKDELYINQLFAEFTSENITLRAGRENLKLGSRRLVDPREGPNVRRSFDHISLSWDTERGNYLLFAGNPMVPESGIFDNLQFQNKEYLWGLYAGSILKGALTLDAYYLGTNYESSTYALGTASERRHSLGIRTWKTHGNWVMDNEAIFQFGEFGNQDIFAWTVSFDIRNRISKASKLGVKTEVISGTTSSNILGTFNPLYPRGAYFGRVARFGPANLIDVHPYWQFVSGRYTVELDYDVFWRYSKSDAVYGPAMNIVLAGESDARFIAQQLGTVINYQFGPYASIELEMNYIFSGEYIEVSSPGAMDLFHMVITAQVNF